MEWKIAQAKQRFSELVQAALAEPQPIYKRNHLVAFVVEADLFQEFLEWQQRRKEKSVADVFAEVRQVAVEEEFVLEIASREDRSNPFIDDDDVFVCF
ncbi:prevent-host-death protein [cf. Phormidesmis sp. LEGE 11477]|uniref:prevent-host-death protein n=1 Tax=cf. Phormidesmis sp. LEGE 11477 TaxID=1828680 RepID=UPI00187FC3F7|nr:prevent-host-death protein [cf. Phormidesmis sp. LEGE 11477]MBE9059960.1 prevent-host-death protein [cf. Phormidesmis sp. LEGE 11477]